jgi:hypothetical protein
MCEVLLMSEVAGLDNDGLLERAEAIADRESSPELTELVRRYWRELENNRRLQSLVADYFTRLEEATWGLTEERWRQLLDLAVSGQAHNIWARKEALAKGLEQALAEIARLRQERGADWRQPLNTARSPLATDVAQVTDDWTVSVFLPTGWHVPRQDDVLFVGDATSVVYFAAVESVDPVGMCLRVDLANPIRPRPTGLSPNAGASDSPAASCEAADGTP